MSATGILAHQLKAGRTLARMDQQELADRSGVSVPTIKRMEAGDGPIRGTYENVAAVVAVIESAGVEFTNGDKPGVQLARQPGDAAKPASYKAIVKAASASKAKPAAKPRGSRPAKGSGKSGI